MLIMLYFSTKLTSRDVEFPLQSLKTEAGFPEDAGCVPKHTVGEKQYVYA